MTREEFTEWCNAIPGATGDWWAANRLNPEAEASIRFANGVRFSVRARSIERAADELHDAIQAAASASALRRQDDGAEDGEQPR